MLSEKEYEAPEQAYEAVCIAPNGIGFGDGSISADRENDPEYPVGKEQLAQAVELLIAHRDEIIVPVDEADDGCGDGRTAEQVFQVIDGATGEKHEYKKSKNRAKIFGGGLQVAGSMWRAIMGAPKNGETVLGDREFIAGKLKERGIHYGAHTDSHNHGNDENCGCGALDKYAPSTATSGKYRQDITPLVHLFQGEGKAIDAGMEQAFATREALSHDGNYMANASGRKTMKFIESDGAVVKQLGGKHLEAITLMNNEPGTTVDQAKVAELFRAAGLPEGIDVFVIDEWRGRMYADAVADIAVQQGYKDREQAQEIALADFYINQLSIAAILTKGDQPVIYNNAVAA